MRFSHDYVNLRKQFVMFEKAVPAKAGTAGFIWVRSLDVVIDHRGRLVQQLGTGQQPLEVLERGGVIEAVADALVGVDGVVDVLAADDGAVVEDFIFVAFAAKETNTGILPKSYR